MARVRPFAGWRYARHGHDISAVTAPPYDVISDERREEFIKRDAENTVALELPAGRLDPMVPRNRYDTGRQTWDRWRAEGVVAAEAEPCVYVLEQRFEVNGAEVRRRAFITEVGLEPFEAGVVLPHERTLPKALGDRFELIKATGANFSQVLGLFDDPDCATNALFDAAMAEEPVSEATDDDGVKSVLWASADPNLARKLAELFDDKQIFIADGHHRYTTALAYRDLRRQQELEKGRAVQHAPYDFVMMALVNMDDPDLVVLPTHRVADAAADFDPEAFRVGLLEHFIVEELPPGHPAAALDGFDGPVFITKTRFDESPFRIRLRPGTDLDAVMPSSRSAAWKALDVAVLQELILDPLLGIHPDRPETLERLSFVKDPHEALEATADHDVAFVLRPTKMQQLRAVALAGETMPQKSTYFYPKLLSGMVYRSAE
jgi:uncharacterized protein (DUF1015 family)